MTAAEMFTVTEPGVYDGMPEHVYHGDPVPGGSLSSSGARKLLPPSCPAKFRYEQDNPPEPKPWFDFGTAAHRQVLGVGPPIESLHFEDWRSKAAQQARDEARAQGYVPLLKAETMRVFAMADALQEHSVARQLFSPVHGKAEQSLFWHEFEFDVWRRARFDWLPEPAGGRHVLVDYKTTAAADPDSFRKSAANYGYDQQAAWYLDAAAAVLGDPEAAFIFCAQEKDPPYLVAIYQLEQEWLSAARERNRRAIEVYAQCRETGEWPGYPVDIPELSAPPWRLL